MVTAYGDSLWDLTDPDKKKYIDKLKGGLICFCSLLDEIIEPE